MTQPRRWLADQSQLPPQLRRALLAAPGEPSAEQLQQVASHLGAALGAVAAPALLKSAASGTQALSGGTASAAAGGAATTKPLAVLGAWVMGGLVVGSGLSGVAYSLTSAEAPAPKVVVAKPTAMVAAPTPVTAPERPTTAATPSADASSHEAAPGKLPAPRAPQAERQNGAAAAETELSLLKRAQANATTAPSEALALTKLHANRFPSGALSQEREVIAIDALVRLGRVAEAAQRAERFQANYPGSAHARRLSAQFEAKP